MLHGGQIIHLFIAKACRITQGNLILIPHVIDLAFDIVFQLFLLFTQTIDFFVQSIHAL